MRSKRVLPAEWETDCSILLAWPHAGTDWNYMLQEIEVCYIRLVQAFTKYHRVVIVAPDTSVPRSKLEYIDPSRILYVTLPTNDTWARDFGPISVLDDGLFRVCDFKFNGWGLKFPASFDNLVTSGLVGKGLINAEYENHLSFVLEGGSIESDGKGTVLTTSECLLSPNRNGGMTAAEIETYLRKALGAESILWLDHGALAGDDTDSHVDTLARMAPHDTIVYVGCDDEHDQHFDQIQAMKEDIRQLRTRDGLPYNLVELPFADAVFDDDGERLPATYANYLVTRKAVFMPTYGSPLKDDLAAKILNMVYELPVEPVNCLPLIKQHGSLHCATMQLPNDILSI